MTYICDDEGPVQQAHVYVMQLTADEKSGPDIIDALLCTGSSRKARTLTHDEGNVTRKLETSRRLFDIDNK